MKSVLKNDKKRIVYFLVSSLLLGTLVAGLTFFASVRADGTKGWPLGNEKYADFCSETDINEVSEYRMGSEAPNPLPPCAHLIFEPHYFVLNTLIFGSLAFVMLFIFTAIPSVIVRSVIFAVAIILVLALVIMLLRERPKIVGL